MPYLRLKIPFVFFVLVLTLMPFLSRAQERYRRMVFHIDSLINMGQPRKALAAVAQLDQMAHQQHNPGHIIKAVIFRINLQSYLEENARPAIIKTLTADIVAADYPEKPVLQSLLAQMYWQYYEQDRWKISSRGYIDKEPTDFTQWDARRLQDEVNRLYKSSLSMAEQEQYTPVSIFNEVLMGDSSTRELRPTLYDLLVHRAIDHFNNDESDLTHPVEHFTIDNPAFFGDARTFVALPINMRDTVSNLYNALSYLQQATQFHLRVGDVLPLVDLDLQRFELLKTHFEGENKDSLYLQSLKGLVSATRGYPINAMVLANLSAFDQLRNNLVAAFGYAQEAVRLYPESEGGKKAAADLETIRQKDLTTKTEETNIPGKPILAVISYRNVKTATVEVYALTTKLKKQLGSKEEEDVYLNTKNITILKSPLQQHTLELPGTEDYRSHGAEFKIDPLPPGHYLMVTRAKDDKQADLTTFTDFQISRLSWVSRKTPDNRLEIRVLDRETGAPLPNVKVAFYKKELVKNKRREVKIHEAFSNREGAAYFPVDDMNGEIELSTTDDRFVDETPGNLGNAEVPLINHYTSVNTILFTDRRIYRPGQTVYFKGIMLKTTDDGKSKLVTHELVTVNLVDRDMNHLATLRLTTNDFGSVSGSFIIPRGMLNGNLSLMTPYSRSVISVEEYKRPTLTINFYPVERVFHLNDTLTIKGRVVVFSGYGIRHAQVSYHIRRTITLPDSLKDGRDDDDQSEIAIAADTVFTSGNGDFEICYQPALPHHIIPGAVYNYTIEADATDASGETLSTSADILASAMPVKIEAGLPKNYFPSDTASTAVALRDLNGQKQDGRVHLQIFSLRQPGETFKPRIEGLLDQVIMTKEAFKHDFPEYAWKGEDDVKNWQRLTLIDEQQLSLSKNGSSTVSLDIFKKQPSGLYCVEMSGRTNTGDTTSSIQYINVINADARPQKIDKWVIVEHSVVKKGEKAVLWVGNGHKEKVLLERFDGEKLLSSNWLDLGGPFLHRIEIDVPVTPKNSFSVQLMAVNDNASYTDYEAIRVEDTLKPLKMHFVSFRDKLEPGGKEHWKISIADGTQKPAEVLASMYDASLDAVIRPDNWATELRESFLTPQTGKWDENVFVAQTESSRIIPPPAPIDNIDIEPPHGYYEELNLMDLSYNKAAEGYFRGDEKVQDARKNAKFNRKIAIDYQRLCKLIVAGFDIVGRVTNEYGVGLALVKIRMTGLSTIMQSNSKGYFRLKVPKGGVLQFSKKGFFHADLKIDKADIYIVKLRTKGMALMSTAYNIKSADPSVQSIKGDPNAEIRIDGPVGNSENASFRYSDKLYDTPSPVNQFRFPLPVVKTDAEKLIPITKVSMMGVESPPIALRKNFSETAFFYPQLTTNEQGETQIDFTVPDALTKWRFRAFAHNLQLQTGYLQTDVVTQKQLSIMANMPRFLHEGDTLIVSARVSNLTEEPLNAKVHLQLFNALNMQPVSLFANTVQGTQQIKITAGANSAVSFKLFIPAGLDAVTYRLTAEADTHTDGEENTLPVLPDRMLVTESMPMMVRSGQTRNFSFNKLINQHSATLVNKSLTLEYTSNPVWEAVAALPYLIEFPYECSEQIFSRYYANSLSSAIVNHNPLIKRVFEQWRSAGGKELVSDLEKNPELKNTLLEETPWLRDAVSETEQKKRMALLFDLNNMSNQLEATLDKLQHRQLPDGGFPWFGGESSDRFITQHIVAGLGQLYHLEIADVKNTKLKDVADGALQYVDRQLSRDDITYRRDKVGYPTRWLSSMEIHAWYARSYYPKAMLTGTDLQRAWKTYLTRAEKQWKLRNVYEQAMIALTLFRNGEQDVSRQIIRSLKETAQQSDELGMYWAKNRLGYYWYESPVETQSLMIELFTEAAHDDQAVSEMKIWLLRSKQVSNWRTTKATAAACYALLMHGDNLLADTGKTQISINRQPLAQLKPDIKAEAGTGYIKTSWTGGDIKPELGNVSVTNNTKTVNWGAFYWQYTEKLDKITAASADIQLERKYFIQKQTDRGPVLTEVDTQHQPKTGDLLKVVVYLKAARDYEYVQLKDMRPAGTEPVDVLSSYKYQDGLSYYQVTKDVATNFFISWLNKGSYVFEYSLRVVQPGNFSTGISTVQCMYAPEYNAHSEGKRISFGK